MTSVFVTRMKCSFVSFTTSPILDAVFHANANRAATGLACVWMSVCTTDRGISTACFRGILAPCARRPVDSRLSVGVGTPVFFIRAAIVLACDSAVWRVNGCAMMKRAHLGALAKSSEFGHKGGSTAPCGSRISRCKGSFHTCQRFRDRKILGSALLGNRLGQKVIEYSPAWIVLP